MIGSALKEEALKRGWGVEILSRKSGPGLISWDPENETISLTESRSFDAIINLAGTSIAGGRWTEKRKLDIVDSRVKACRTLEKYLQEGKLITPFYLGASAIGIYGDREDRPVDELSAIDPNGDWMVQTVVQWEKGHKRIEALGIRTVILRIGIVLSLKGGALPEMLQTAAFGVLGYFGSGRQIWPWIHIDDLIRSMVYAIEEDSMKGTYLAVAPEPVSNKEMASAASRQYSPSRLVIPVPEFVLNVMLGEMHNMLMQSCNAFPKRLLDEKFQFRHSGINVAMEELLAKE